VSKSLWNLNTACWVQPAFLNTGGVSCGEKEWGIENKEGKAWLLSWRSNLHLLTMMPQKKTLNNVIVFD
jgi:hypothetical protein